MDKSHPSGKGTAPVRVGDVAVCVSTRQIMNSNIAPCGNFASSFLLNIPRIGSMFLRSNLSAAKAYESTSAGSNCACPVDLYRDGELASSLDRRRLRRCNFSADARLTPLAQDQFNEVLRLERDFWRMTWEG